MAEYIERDKKRLTRLCREAQRFQDDIVCSVGTDFMQTIAEAENRMIFDILKGLQEEPAADVVEVRHGKWDENGRCTLCGGHAPFWCMASTYYESPYCFECGAKMDGKGDGE